MKIIDLPRSPFEREIELLDKELRGLRYPNNYRRLGGRRRLCVEEKKS